MKKHIEDEFRAPTAVVDWIEFQIQLRRCSHGGHLKRCYESDGVSFVKPLNKSGGGAASEFRIRLQNPRCYGVVEDVLTDLATRYGLTAIPTLMSMEVSLDFWHRDAEPNALSAMTERLMRSLVPPEIENPRLCGNGRDLSESLLPSRSVQISSAKTLYIGNRADDLMWRVYWKKTDDSFEDEGGARIPKPLPPDQCRARVEVRIQGNEIRNLGLSHVADLRHFQYQRLHARQFFKFAKRSWRGRIIPEPYRQAVIRTLGSEDEWPASCINTYGRSDSRKRPRRMSRHLVTDTELTEAARTALRNLTARFSHSARTSVLASR